MYISAPLKGGRRHQGVSPFYCMCPRKISTGIPWHSTGSSTNVSLLSSLRRGPIRHLPPPGLQSTRWELDSSGRSSAGPAPFFVDVTNNIRHTTMSNSLKQENEYPIGSMYAIYMVTFTINIPPMLAYIPYMDPMGIDLNILWILLCRMRAVDGSLQKAGTAINWSCFAWVAVALPHTCFIYSIS